MAEELPQDIKEAIMRARNREQWLRFDSIVIGPGATTATPTWYENFAAFADATELTWFTSTRDRQAGPAYVNSSSGGKENFGQMIYQSGIEFYYPPGILNAERQAFDANYGPEFFLQELPRRMKFDIKLQDTDNILNLPGIHMPAGVGVSGMNASAAGALHNIAGQTGDGSLRATWNWPDPIPVPSNMQISVTALIDRPLRKFLQALTTVPATKEIPVNGVSVPYPNWAFIRIWHRGPRLVQLRGAYSANGAS